MNILHSIIHQVLIFNYEEIPLSRILHRNVIAELAAIFKFSETSSTENNPGPTFVSGIFTDELGEYPILRLVIEDRRILVDMEGTSKNADKLIGKLKEFFAKLIGNVDVSYLLPIVKAQESEIIVKLNFPAEKLYNPVLIKLLENQASGSFSYDHADALLTPSLVQFVVSYKPRDMVLDDSRININRKEFQIGARPGYPVSAKVFYSKAPTDTDTHISMLQSLEDVLSTE